jgi:uncharacterized protein
MNHVHEMIAVQFPRSLKALRTILKKGQGFAQDRKFDENVLLQARLAPDMLPLVKQVQITTDNAKGAVARLTGKTVPAFADDETTLEQLLARIDKTITVLQDTKPDDFKDYATKKITFHYIPGKEISGADYFSSHLIPNFYFHMATTYALFRSSGVHIGKGDYLGEQNWKTV